jgi:predicted permease
MSNTDSDTWEYLPVLNTGLQILATIALGAAMGAMGFFQEKTFTPIAVKFVFSAALPCEIIRGIGIYVDFYNDKFLWNYIKAFLYLRVIFLLISFLSLYAGKNKDFGLGELAVRWLALTWISTVILGIPIISAVFGDAIQGAFLGLLAGISSFIFQLPVQLCLLECHVLEQEYLESGKRGTTNDTQAIDIENIGHDKIIAPSLQGIDSSDNDIDIQNAHVGGTEPRVPGKSAVVEGTTPGTSRRRLRLWATLVSEPGIWKKIGFKLVRNPILWAVFVGFVVSLSTIGREFLNPTNGSDRFVHGLAWIELTLGWLGACVSPVSLFAMGVWMQAQGRQLVAVGPIQMTLYMLSKLVAVPFLMLGLAKALDLNDVAGRAAVLIATLPISLASFSLGSQYKIGEATLSTTSLTTMLRRRCGPFQ